MNSDLFRRSRCAGWTLPRQSVKKCLLRHIANGVDASRAVPWRSTQSVVIAPGAMILCRHHPAGQDRHRRGLRHRPQQPH